MNRLGASLLLGLAACAGRASPDAAGAAGPPTAVGGPWVTTVRADHPLVGRIWHQGAFVGEETMLADLRAADFVLLGERHDSADHHRLQGRVIAAVRPAAVGFEMLDAEDDLSGSTPDALAESTGWADSGWPAFDLYRPVFEATLEAGATVVAAHPTRDQVRTAMREGPAALGEAAAGLPERPLTAAATADLDAEIVASHCGHASPEVVGMMTTVQVLKDAWMARALARVGPKAVLIAGNGHTRTDRGVPWYLDGEVRAVSFVEVAEPTDPAAYEVAADYVWFTPRVDEEDPCEKFREQLEKMHAPE